MNTSFTVSTAADAGETDQLPGIFDALIDLAAGRPQGIILVAALAGGPRCRIDLAGFARAAGVPRSSLSRAKRQLIADGILIVHGDGSLSIEEYGRWPSLQSRPELLAWIARPPADDETPTAAP